MPLSNEPTPKPSTETPTGLIESPEINSAGKPTRKSITTVQMAQEVIKTVIAAGRNRAIVNSRILAKHNAERPYDAKKLEQDGLGWRQNFSTKPLAALVEKVYPRFTEVIEGLKYFTDSKLPDKYENATQKTEFFRDTITKTIRKKKEWTTVIENIAFDDSLFGGTVVAWLDEYSFMPKHFRTDEWFLADGTKQNVAFAQVAVLRENLLPHEFFQMIEDPEAAKTVGWKLQACRELINKAVPKQVAERLDYGGTLEHWYQNAQRELTVGCSYMAGANVCVLYSLLVREVTGKISHYRLGGEKYDLLFEKDDRFERAEDCLAFFSYEKGNDTMYGSKGIGRNLYELAGMIDRTRNEVVDRAIMSGKTFVQGNLKKLNQFKMSVIGAMAIVPEDWKFLEHKIDGNVEPMLKLDAYISAIADQLIGSVSIPKVEGEAFRSPQAWNMLAQREEEGRDSKIVRFMNQFTSLVATMQKRICDPECIDPEAKAARELLLTKMSSEELKELANQPVVSSIKDLTPMQRQLTVAIAAEKRGNPLYNQRQLEVEDLNARMDAEFANRVLLPSNDPTEQAEQQRLQQMEIMLLSQAQPVPVSPRDNHMIHLEMLMPTAEGMAQQLGQGQTDTAVLEAIIAHITEHYNRAVEQKVATKEQLAPIKKLVDTAGQAIAELKALDAQAAQMQQESATLDEVEMMEQQAMAAGVDPNVPVPVPTQ
jgi:hypothetical protein